MRVPVWVESWQHQCCGKDFRVGSLVRWHLTTDTDSDSFLSEALGNRAPSWSATLPRLDVSVQIDAGGGFAARGDGLSVFVPLPFGEPAPASVQVQLLREDHHVGVPGVVPVTTGTVAHVSLVRFTHALREDVTLWPVPGGAELERTAIADKWPPERVNGRDFAGYLVDLAVQEDPGLVHCPYNGV